MNILILSRNAGLYSTQSLVNAGRKRNHVVKVIDHMQCDVINGDRLLEIYYRRQRLRGVEALIPRIGASATSYGAVVIRQFMLQGVYSVLTPSALMQSRNKFSCLQLLSANDLPIPKTLISAYGVSAQEIYDNLGDPPYIIKLLESTHGEGVFKANSLQIAENMLSSFMQNQQQVIIQEYIEESRGEDIRVLVVGNKVVASMRRVAAQGEFRSNLHRGGMGYKVNLTAEEQKVALHAAEVMGLSVAGVDMLRSNRGPLILEINASPGLEGIERVTQVDIAGRIIELCEKQEYYKFEL